MLVYDMFSPFETELNTQKSILQQPTLDVGGAYSPLDDPSPANLFSHRPAHL